MNSWLTAKLIGLLAYILFGRMVLKRGLTRVIRPRHFYFVLTRNPPVFV